MVQGTITMNEPTTDKMEAIAPTVFPGIEKRYECLCPDYCVQIYFISEVQALVMSKTTGDSEMVAISMLKIRDGLFLVHWTEEDGTVVASIQDHHNATVTTCTTFHRATLCRQGRFREVQM